MEALKALLASATAAAAADRPGGDELSEAAREQMEARIDGYNLQLKLSFEENQRLALQAQGERLRETHEQERQQLLLVDTNLRLRCERLEHERLEAAAAREQAVAETAALRAAQVLAAAENQAHLEAAGAARLEAEGLRRRAESAETRGIAAVGKVAVRGAAARAAAMGEVMRAEVARVGVGVTRHGQNRPPWQDPVSGVTPAPPQGGI